MKNLVMIAIACVGSLTLSAVKEVKIYQASQIKSLDIVNTSGEIEIKATDSKNAKVEAEKVEFSENCKLKTATNGSTLKIKVTKKGNRTKCEVNFVIEVPTQVEVKAKSGSGDIEVKGIEGQIEAALGSGDIEVDGLVKGVNVKSGSGDVEIKGLVASAQAKTGSGDIKLAYRGSPKGEVRVRTGSGDILLSLPSEVSVSASLKTGSGKIFNEFKNSDKPQLTITARTGSGSLTLKKSKKK